MKIGACFQQSRYFDIITFTLDQLQIFKASMDTDMPNQCILISAK